MRSGVDMKKKVALLIPSMGNISCFIKMIDSLVNQTFYQDLNVFITFNPKNDERSLAAAGSCMTYAENVAKNIAILRERRINLKSYLVPKPIGYGGAINHSYRGMVEYEKENSIKHDYIIFGNDDLVFTSRWLEIFLGGAEDEEHNYTMSSHYFNSRNIKEQHKFGLFGPISDCVAGEQKIHQEDAGKSYSEIAYHLAHQEPTCRATTFLSGFCMMAKRELIEDLRDTLEFPEDGPIDERNFPIGGFEDNDICKRALSKGWKLKIVNNCFIGHIGSQSLPEEQRSGLANRLPYYLKWEEETKNPDKKCIAAYRTSIKTINELAQMLSSIMNTAPLVDGIGMLITNNPSESLKSYDSKMYGQLPNFAQQFLKECEGLSMDAVANLIEKFILKILENSPYKIPVTVKHWDGEFNERDERNETHKICEDMGADYIMSVDTDEFPEDRIDRNLFRRYLRHPDPSMTHYAVGWLNHWETHNLLRVDPPFNRQSGPRIWKVLPDNYRITGGSDIGLHCGNSPEYSLLGLRASAFRFRHLSHVRGIDRWAKMKFYENIDKEKNIDLIGNSNYSHISKQEQVKVSLYNPKNGIGSFMLAYEDEDPDLVGGWLDYLYSISDKLVLVWTGEWSDEDKEWITDHNGKTKVSKEDWKYTTGPTWELAQYIRLFEVEIIHSKLSEETGLAGCRNAAIDYLCENSNDNNISWALTFDPDEITANHTLFFANLVYMATMNDLNGFLFKFDNLVKGKDGRISAAPSEAIRMFKLDPTGVWRMNGRVHETFEAAAEKLRSIGQEPSIQILNDPRMKLRNMGLLKTPEQMSEKLKKYQKLLFNELNSNPFKSSAWVALGLQYLNDGMDEMGKTCLDRGCMTAGKAYLPFKERAYFSLREGLAMLKQSRIRLNDSWEWSKTCDQMIELLEQMAPPIPIVDTHADLSRGEELPPFPYDRIGISEEGHFYIKPEEDVHESEDKGNKEHH